MALTPGTRIGSYEITAQIGVGGMGEVYRATDTNLGRAVAIKVLPDALAFDSERLARFDREARTFAALNHPNIAAIYGLEKSGGQTALVMELVDGPTLADRIAQGPIPVDEALPIAKQITEALEAAHEQGIIHRDLKPANVKVRPDGTVKVLDFGLAKAMAPEAAAVSGSLSMSPTITTPAMTQAGMILGTAAYMSPEQARGTPVDGRTDVWAFGCVLFEMLAGRPAFGGESVVDVLGSVVKADPDWTLLAGAPTWLARLVERCLQKDVRRRLRHIGDARLELDDPPLQPTSGATDSDGGRGLWLVVPWGLAGVLALTTLVLGWRLTSRNVAPGPVIQLEAELPQMLPIGTDLALSPDGQHLVYIGTTGTGGVALYRRSLRDPVVERIRGTDGASYPFFSPDGRQVAFLSGNELQRVPLEGGAPTVIARTPEAYGSTWSDGGQIVFGYPGDGLFQVPAEGGTPARLTTPASEGESHTNPRFLSGGDSVVFTVVDTDGDSRVAIVSLDRPDEWSVLTDGSKPIYVPSGHLLFVRSGALMAAPFDVRTGTIRSEATALLDGIADAIMGFAYYDVSNAGHLVYLTWMNQLATSTLMWVDRNGDEEPVAPTQEGGSLQPALSPAGDRIAFGLLSQAPNIVLATYELASGRLTPMLPGTRTLSNWPTWSPSGDRLAFVSSRAAGFNTWVTPADGSGAAEQLTFERVRTIPTSWSVNDVLALEQGAVGDRDIVFLSMNGSRDLVPFLAGDFDDRAGEFSPDGQWLAFTSDRSGRDEVWVVAASGEGAPELVSIGGGEESMWSRDGRELFYRNGDQMMQATIAMTPTFHASPPTPLFQGDYTYGYQDWSGNYDVSADGRFLMVKEGPAPRLQVVVNWLEELKARVPIE